MAERPQLDHIYDSSGKLNSTGSANAYVIEVAEQIAGYHQGMPPIRFKANFGNTGSATANIVTQTAPAGLGAVTLKKNGGATNLASGDIVSGGVYTLIHDGTNFQVLELNGVIAAGSVGTAALADDAVTNAKLANMAEATIKGRAVGAGTGDPTDLTATQATAILNAFTDALKGLVPASGGGTTTFLRADGTFAAPGGITAGTAQATTSGTTIDFTGLPAGIKRITIAFDAVSLSANDDLLVQLGDSGGIEATTYQSTSSVVSTGGTSNSLSTVGFHIANGDSDRQMTGLMVITRINSNSWVSSHTLGNIVTSGTTSMACHGAGRKDLSAELDQIRITRPTTGNFDNGLVNIFYE